LSFEKNNELKYGVQDPEHLTKSKSNTLIEDEILEKCLENGIRRYFMPCNVLKRMKT
jgi:hypothetical protein